MQLHVKDFCRKLFDLHPRLIAVQLSLHRITFNGAMTMQSLVNDYRFPHNERPICDQPPSMKGDELPILNAHVVYVCILNIWQLCFIGDLVPLETNVDS